MLNDHNMHNRDKDKQMVNLYQNLINNHKF